MKKSVRKIALALFVGVLTLALTSFNAEGASSLKWVGCGITKKAFMKELAAAYEKKTGTRIVLKGGGATKGIRAVAAGVADIGGTCRHKLDVPEEEAAKLHQVAWDALVVVVNRDNPVDSITVSQVRDVLTGKIKNWKELGGPDSKINLYVRKGRRGGVGLMAREMLFNNPDQDFAPDAKVKKSSGPLERAISGDVHGFGLSGISSAKKRKKLKMLKVDGIAPTKKNIMTGRYPFYRPLYLTTRGEPTGEVKAFVEFALSAGGQAIISRQGTVNLAEGKSLKIK